MSEEVSEAEFVDAKSQDGEDTLGENIDESKSNSRTMTKDSKEMDEADTAEVQIDEMEIAGDGHSFMCGVVEGFYGRPWTAEQRRELFRRMEEMGLNTYLYGPKDDYKHRLFWREKYSEDEAEILKTLINEAHLHGIVFVYAISPGLDMVFGAEKETNALKEKLTQVKELGCKAFALLFDDIDPVLCAADMKEFDSSANAQAAITNTMFKALDRPRFIFCPTEYCSSMAIPDVENSPYLRTLGTNLDPQISVMWTGAKVVSNIITVESIKLLNGILRRKVMIWDNIHANDYDPKRVFLGPFKGRSTHLIPHLSGVLTNPNCEFESNFVAMHTIASWYKSFKARPKEKDIKEKNDNSSVEKVIDSPDGEPIVDATMPPQIEDSHDSFPPDSESADSSSDQKSDSESDTDSDYSSHEGVYFPSLSIDEHGDYDPNLALEKALKDWLPVFSWIRYPSCKIIPRSGMQPALPRIPTLPITTHSHLPIACVTKTVMVPVSSVGKPDRTPPISASNPIDNDTESMRDTVKDDTLTLEASNEDIQAEKPESEIAVKLTAEVSDAVLNSAPDTTNDVVMCNLSKESARSCDSVSKVSQGDSSGIPTNTVPDVSVEKCETVSRKMSSSADIEMNEENLTEHVEEKKLEDMQIEGSPKPATSQDQMETEDIQEPSTPMQTDDVDSDISMATAQSCTAISVDEIATPSPDCPNVDQSEIKLAELSHKVTFAKVENTKTTDTDSNNDMCTPVMSKKYKSSLVSQLEANPITVDDLRLLVQCFYLPYEHGELGKEMVQKFKWLKENAIKLSRAKDKKSEDYLDKALEWSRKALVFDGHCRDVQQVFNKLCICPNRALLYDIFPYLWDMKGVVTMLRSYVKWLGRIEVRPETPTANDDNKDSTTLAKPAPAVGFGWLGADPEPWAFRGGLSGEFQKLLPIGAAFDLFRQTLPLDPQVSTFIIRPYLPTDEQAVVDVCYATHNDGLDSDVFINHKQLPADKFVGALVTLSPEYCFVVEDDDGLCGYLAATLDAKTFWKKYELAYLPEMREKYEKPADSEEEMTEVERMIVEFHSTEDRFNYGTDELSVSHPSLMALALHPRASCDIAKSMTVCLLSALKSHHSCGVHVLVPQDSGYFLDLYTKLGFVKVYSDEDCTSDTKKLMILGRTF